MKTIALTFALITSAEMSAHAISPVRSCQMLFAPSALALAPSRTDIILPYVGRTAEAVDLYSLWGSLNYPSTITGLQGYAGRVVSTGQTYFVFVAGSTQIVYTENGPQRITENTPPMILDNGRYLFNGIIVDSMPAIKPSKRAVVVRAGLENRMIDKIGMEATALILAKASDVLDRLDKTKSQLLEESLDTLTLAKDKATGETVALMYHIGPHGIDGFYAFQPDGAVITSDDITTLKPKGQTFLLGGQRELVIVPKFYDITRSKTVSHTTQPPAVGKFLGVRPVIASKDFEVSTGRSRVVVSITLKDPIAEKEAAQAQTAAAKKQFEAYQRSLDRLADKIGVSPALFKKLIAEKAFYDVSQPHTSTPALKDLQDAAITIVKPVGQTPLLVLQFKDLVTTRTLVVDPLTAKVAVEARGEVETVVVGSIDVAFIFKDSDQIVIHSLKYGRPYMSVRLNGKNETGKTMVSYSPNGTSLMVATESGARIYRAPGYSQVAHLKDGWLSKTKFTTFSWMNDQLVRATTAAGSIREFAVLK